jgi:hypothetical protein
MGNIILLLCLLIIVFVVVLIISIFNEPKQDNPDRVIKGLFGDCVNNFNCNTGYICELRNHPSKGTCVIPPGGACHTVTDPGNACYSGYYCDKQDGICLLK